MTTFINLTPHAINMPNRVIPASGIVARNAEITRDAGAMDGVELITRTYGAVENLPDPQPDTFYIVSAQIRTALPARRDLLSPGDVVRDEEGKIIGAKNLIINP